MPQVQNKSPYNMALDMLSRRDNSEQEIKQKLSRKGINQEEIGEVLEKLKRNGLVDDSIFAMTYAKHLLAAKPVGPKLLEQKLRQKGLATTAIQQTLQAVEEEYSMNDLAMMAMRKWQRIHPKHAQDRQRLNRFLISRGFTIDQISGLSISEEV